MRTLCRQPLANLAEVQSHKPQAQAAANAQEGKPHAVPRQRRVREDENMVMVRGTRYTKLECVGRGGSSKVYKVSSCPHLCQLWLQVLPVSGSLPASLRVPLMTLITLPWWWLGRSCGQQLWLLTSR